jgi:transcriptional regulator with XRE-family HTH domain
MLAGISSDYYLRLEQGRDHHPSAHVLNALARVLQLDEHATAHLHSLSLASAVSPVFSRGRPSSAVLPHTIGRRSGPDSSLWGEAPAAGGRYGRAECDGMERP